MTFWPWNGKGPLGWSSGQGGHFGEKEGKMTKDLLLGSSQKPRLGH